MMHLLEGESLFNDASGLVMFRFASAAALTGAFSFSEASAGFACLLSFAGAACGFICLIVGVKHAENIVETGKWRAECQVLVLIMLPFLAYLLAEHINASGVLAAVVAGMLAGRAGLFRYLSVSRPA
jgi:NhaP-type Na+/H+ or K+/H+ antiporter